MAGHQAIESISLESRKFFAQAMSTPLLDQESELTLALAWRERNDQRALHRLVSAFMRLVVATAAKFRGYGLPMGDMVQEGCVGLMQAAARFEPERGVRFSTYAGWWIRAAIQDYVLRNWSIVRCGTSASQKSLFFNLRWIKARIEREHHGSDTVLTPQIYDEIASTLQVSTNDVKAMAERLGAHDQSLDAPIGQDGLAGGSFSDLLPDDGPSPEEEVLGRREAETRHKWLKESLAELSAREQMIVRARMLDEERATLEELGERLGVTKERVRQIEARAYAKLRTGVLRRSQEIAA